MFTEILEKYENNGSFTFSPDEDLKEKCNAPTDKSGIYLIYRIIEGNEMLIYIGSSGQRKSDGTLKVRNGGMKDRLVNGYHPNRFDEAKRIKRRRAFPKQMIKENTLQIKIYWWVKYEENLYSDFPTDIEKILRDKYLEKNIAMPDWHK